MPYFLVPARKGRSIPLDKAVIFVGRHPDCDVVLTRSRKVSRKHCCIAQVDDQFMVRDLGSMNGIRVNGDRVRHTKEIKLGDELTIGDVEYVVRNQDRRPNQNQSLSHQDSSETMPSSRPSSSPGMPLDLSQDVPIPIEDDGQSDFAVESSIETCRNRHRDEDDDVIPLDEDGD